MGQSRRYRKELKYKRLLKNNKKGAVVLHLFYIDMWSFFAENLRKLDTSEFDFFITIQEKDQSFITQIQQDFPDSNVFKVPNRGRDVLPFLKIASMLVDQKYEYILKLHSKKSTHRSDGKDWMNRIIADLLPDNLKTMAKILDLLASQECGIIGPHDQYLSLDVNFSANGANMTRVMSGLFGKAVVREVLQESRSNYGFFAGTMFWARLDSIKSLLQYDGIFRFEEEQGQIDGTYAHALERLFCLVPEINKRNIYKVDRNGVREITYNSGLIPDWSDIYIGPVDI